MVPPNQPILSPLLVGRVGERAYLGQALAKARQGQGGVVLLQGEAGVGKSRLAAEARRQAEAGGFDVRIGYCFEGDTDFAYAPLIDTLRTWLALLPEAGVATLLGARAAELVKLLPELAHTIPDLHPTAALDAEAEKRRLMESVYQVLLHATLLPQATPLLLIVEDLHWSDEGSLDFLYLLARRTARLPLLVLGTYRREESPPHLRHWLAQLARERLAHELVLQRLSLDEVATMVQAVLGLAHPAPADLVERLHGLTEGNPFFVEEVLKALVTSGSVLLQDGHWVDTLPKEIQIPESLQDAVFRRTARLSPDAHRVLTVAAVAGYRFDFALLEAITGYGEPALLALVKELTSAQLVVEESADHFAFRHALTQQVVYAGLLTAERRLLHQTIGEALERLHGTALGRQAAYLSYHFHAAGDWARALDYARQAGEQAQALYEPRTAVEQWTRALTAADHLLQPPALAPLLRGRGWAYEILGQFEQARSDYESALHLARKEEDRLAEWQVLLDLGGLWSGQDYAQAGHWLQQALDLARRSQDVQMVAHSLNRIGNWHLNLDQPHAALRYHREALQVFQGIQDQPGQASTLDFLGMASFNCGDLAGSVRHFGQALTLSQVLDDRATLASIWATLTYTGGSYSTETLVPEFASVGREAYTNEPARQLAREIGWRAGEAYALTTLGQAYGYRGDYGRALTYSREALAIAEAIDHREWRAAAHHGLGCLFLDVLALPLARPHAEAAMDLAQRAGSLLWRRMCAALLANVHLALGEPVEAEAILASVSTQEGAGYTLADRLCRLARAELALAAGAPNRALQIVDDLVVTAPNVRRAGRQSLPRLLLLRAEALVALRQEAEAETVLEMAQAGARAQGAVPVLWRILARLAILYDGQARHVEAVSAADAARAVLEQCANTIPEPRIRDALLERADGQLPQSRLSRRGRGISAAGGLTPREIEVAKLIAQGHSNQEIAAALIIAERTVTTHIGHIFEKLGFRRRTQIATWAAERGWSKTDEAPD